MATYYDGPRTLTYKITEAGLEASDGLAGHCKDLVFTPKMGSRGGYCVEKQHDLTHCLTESGCCYRINYVILSSLIFLNQTVMVF